jgi:hypothetical protein
MHGCWPGAQSHQSDLHNVCVVMFSCVHVLLHPQLGCTHHHQRPGAFSQSSASCFSQITKLWPFRAGSFASPCLCCLIRPPGYLQLGGNWFPMSQKNCNILCWNVRGLNDVVRQDTVNLLVKDTAASIVCLQETKLQNMDLGVVRRTVGAKFTSNFIVLPAAQTRGGILLAAHEDFFPAHRPPLIYTRYDGNLHHEGRWVQMAAHCGIWTTR